jgi:hypothetical protein
MKIRLGGLHWCDGGLPPRNPPEHAQSPSASTKENTMDGHNHASQHGGRHHYRMFAVNMLLSLIVMYFVMFSMIDGWGDFRNNLNMFYMALTMVAPMGIIMLATMGMYRNKTS